jgi:hypothetical protein
LRKPARLNLLHRDLYNVINDSQPSKQSWRGRLSLLKARLISLVPKMYELLNPFAKGSSKGKTVARLPSRKPPLAELRPGHQHCQIHDPDYLLQILQAEIDSSNGPTPTSNRKLADR